MQGCSKSKDILLIKVVKLLPEIQLKQQSGICVVYFTHLLQSIDSKLSSSLAVVWS